MAKLKSVTGTTKGVAIRNTATTTATAPDGTKGDVYYDSDKSALMAYNTSWQMISRATAAGGAETEYSGYKSHRFLLANDGENFVVSGGSMTVDYLIVGGGGSGSGGNVHPNGDGAGGGGGGALRTATGVSLGSGSYAVEVGAGGAAITESNDEGITGLASSFNSISSDGGGGGGEPNVVGNTNGNASSGGRQVLNSSSLLLLTAHR